MSNRIQCTGCGFFFEVTSPAVIGNSVCPICQHEAIRSWELRTFKQKNIDTNNSKNEENRMFKFYCPGCGISFNTGGWVMCNSCKERDDVKIHRGDYESYIKKNADLELENATLKMIEQNHFKCRRIYMEKCEENENLRAEIEEQARVNRDLCYRDTENRKEILKLEEENEKLKADDKKYYKDLYDRSLSRDAYDRLKSTYDADIAYLNKEISELKAENKKLKSEAKPTNWVVKFDDERIEQMAKRLDELLSKQDAPSPDCNTKPSYRPCPACIGYAQLTSLKNYMCTMCGGGGFILGVLNEKTKP